MYEVVSCAEVLPYSTPFNFAERRIVTLVIEELGGRIATMWSELRSQTRGFVERALQNNNTLNVRNFPYDARADLELSRFLAALDDRASEKNSLDQDTANKLKSVADACTVILVDKTESAEVFAQLVKRAQTHHDYKQIDRLGDALTARFPASEICELARSEDAVVRELAYEALSRSPVTILASLLNDPIDSEIARVALRLQVAEYGSEDALQIVSLLDQVEER